jgi:hypothetical protein
MIRTLYSAIFNLILLLPAYNNEWIVFLYLITISRICFHDDSITRLGHSARCFLVVPTRLTASPAKGSCRRCNRHDVFAFFVTLAASAVVYDKLRCTRIPTTIGFGGAIGL